MKLNEIESILETRAPKNKSKRNVIGVGINDAPFAISGVFDGKTITHRAYRAWFQMLMRCYDQKYLAKKPSYNGMQTCRLWFSFMGFLPWWKTNFRDGFHLDKDLLVTGNKIYSPDTCVYVPPALNTFTADNACVRGEYPIGVTWNRGMRKFVAEVNSREGKRLFLGSFKTPDEAYEAWLSAKLSIAESYKETCDEIHPRLYSGLISKIKSMR